MNDATDSTTTSAPHPAQPTDAANPDNAEPNAQPAPGRGPWLAIMFMAIALLLLCVGLVLLAWRSGPLPAG